MRFSAIIRRATAHGMAAPRTTAVAEDQVALQDGSVTRGNLDAGKFAEAGVDAIDRFGSGGGFGNSRRGRVDRRAAGGGKPR
jgi:hypothetical protein